MKRRPKDRKYGCTVAGLTAVPRTFPVNLLQAARLALPAAIQPPGTSALVLP